MVTDRQMRRLMSLLQDGQSLQVSADKAGMDRGTARKYRQAGQLPSALRTDHGWRTRANPFVAVYLSDDEGGNGQRVIWVAQPRLRKNTFPQP